MAEGGGDGGGSGDDEDEKIDSGLGFYYKIIDGSSVEITGITDLSRTSLFIPEIVDGYCVFSIGDNAFCACSNLLNISNLGNCVSIGVEAFMGDSKLTSIILPDTLITIGPEAFSDTGLTEITIPENVAEIGWSAFDIITLSNVVINAIAPPILLRPGDMGTYTFGFDSEIPISVPSVSIDIYKNAAF